jgi:hypothetical protein
MSGTAGSSNVSLVLALPVGRPFVQRWVAVSANSPDVPARRIWPAYPQVIHAEYKPRLTAEELRALQRRAVAGALATSPAEVAGSIGDREARRSSATGAHRSGNCRAWWSSWPAPVLAAAVLWMGTPLF